MSLRMKTMSSAETDSASISPDRLAFAASVPEPKPERKAGGEFFYALTRRHTGARLGIRISGGEQQLRLMRSQCLCRFVTCRPPFETPFRQALCGDPEPLTVIG